MGQSLSRRPRASTPTPAASTPAPEPQQPNDTYSPRRSLPRRILSSIRKPFLRSRPISSSLAQPTRSEQTLRGKSRRWRLSRRQNIVSSTEGPVPEHMGRLTEHDGHQVDRDVDDFGVITHRVPDNHTDSPAASAKGKERAENALDVEDDNADDDQSLIPSTSTAPPVIQSGAGTDPIGDDEVIIVPTVTSLPPCQPSSSRPAQQSERPSVPEPPSPPQLSTQQANTNPRPFPSPGTLVVVQGVVHTTDVPRSSDRPSTTPNPIPPPTQDPPSSSSITDPSSTRPSSVPPETRPRSHLSSILQRPTGMSPTVPTSEPAMGSSSIDPRITPNISGAVEDSEDEDRTRTHPHGFSMAQGPVGASGLSASSIDVLGTLLSVAAAATAASLLTGSSEPIFSSGLTSSQSAPSPNSFPQPASFNSSVPSERPLSPTPTSDAGRMRHVWSSLRDRLGLGSGAHNANHSTDVHSASGSAQIAPSQPSDIARPRDPREIMLAEMARAFNLGLGLGGTTSNTPSTTTANPNTDEFATPVGGDVDGDVEQSTLPPPDSFERFLMDLQTDLRVTLMQEQEPTVIGAPRDADETAEGAERDQSIPELQSLSDSDSDELGTRHFESDDEDQLDREDDLDNEDEEGDVHTAQEQLSGRTSPAVSALGSSMQYRSGAGSTAGMSVAPTETSQSVSRAFSFGTEGERNNGLASNVNGTYVPVDGSGLSGFQSDEVSTAQREGAVLGVVHSREASNGVQAEGCTVSGSIAVPPLAAQDPSNVSGTDQEPSLPGTSSSHPTPNTPNPFSGSLAPTPQPPTQSSISTSPTSSDPESTARTQSPTNSIQGDPPMPFRLPFMPSSASRTEHTPGGGINWWRMYRFPAITSPNLGSSTLSQPPVRNSGQGPNHSSASPWTQTTVQNEVIASRGVAQVPTVYSGLAAPALTPSTATATNMPENVSASESTSAPTSPNGLDSDSPTNTSTNPSEHRSNVVVPVIVVGLQSVNMDRHAPRIPNPHANHAPTGDDEDGEGVEFDGLEPPMPMPLHIPEPAESRHHSSSLNTAQPDQSGQQSSRGRRWQSRAANAFRNLTLSRRNADTTSSPPLEAPGSRTFLIYVIGGYYPPDHQIITGGNLDSFEALWELAELLGQVKPPTVSKEEIEKSGLEVIKATMLGQYENQGRVASNCIDRCLICLDDYAPEEDLRVLSCKHTFHQGCVDRWLETGRNNCPACRTKGVNNENAAPTAIPDTIA